MAHIALCEAVQSPHPPRTYDHMLFALTRTGLPATRHFPKSAGWQDRFVGGPKQMVHAHGSTASPACQVKGVVPPERLELPTL